MTSLSFICALCEKTHLAPDAKLPIGWVQGSSGRPICDDCSQPVLEVAKDAEIGRVSARCETAIPLLSGLYLDLADPDCSIVTPIDIAAGLRQARFGALTRDFYTIAQHSLLVLRLVSPLARSLGGEKGLQLRRCALMHDSAEAIIHDIVTPLKRQLPEYRAIEARLEGRLADHFGWDWTQFRRDAVKRADLEALAIEQRDIKRMQDPWPLLDTVDRDRLRSIKITRCWHPDEAQDRFLTAFEDLFPTEERNAA